VQAHRSLWLLTLVSLNAGRQAQHEYNENKRRLFMSVKDYGKRIIVFFVSVLLVAVLTAAFAYVWYTVYGLKIKLPFWRRGNILVVLIYGIILLLFAKMYSALRVGYLKRIDVMTSWVITILCANVIEYFQMSLINRGLMDIRPMLVLSVFDFAAVVLWTFFSGWVYRRLYKSRRLLVIYGEHAPDQFLKKLMRRRDKFSIGEKIHISAGEKEIFKKIREYDAVVIWDLPSQIRNRFVKFCFSHSIRCYMTPKISDIIIRGADRMHLFDTPLLIARNRGLTIEQQIVKRLMDIVISSIAIVILSPAMLLIALCVKFYDGGPVLYRQERLTIGAKPFMIYKFRSMRVDSEKDGVQLAKKNDDRVTPVGKVLRNLHVDELPQLFNIFKGDMSVVGPRPERKAIVRTYERNIPEFHYRMKVKAGLTGYAQVYGKYNTTPYDKLKLDLFYIENYSLWLDLQLLFMTARIFFQKETSEGVENWQKNALYTEHEETKNDEKL